MRRRPISRQKFILSGVAIVSVMLILVLGIMLVNLLDKTDPAPEAPRISPDLTAAPTAAPAAVQEQIPIIDPETKLNDDISSILQYISLSGEAPPKPVTDDFTDFATASL